MTNSEVVPWGKGEKNPLMGSEKEHETLCWQAVGGYIVTDRVPVEEWAGDLEKMAWLRKKIRSRSESKSE